MTLSRSVKMFPLYTVVVVGATCLVGAAVAQGPAEDNLPFTLNGKTWVSKKAFIDSGGRCAARNVDSIEADQIEAALVSRF